VRVHPRFAGSSRAKARVSARHEGTSSWDPWDGSSWSQNWSQTWPDQVGRSWTTACPAAPNVLKQARFLHAPGRSGPGPDALRGVRVPLPHRPPAAQRRARRPPGLRSSAACARHVGMGPPIGHRRSTSTTGQPKGRGTKTAHHIASLDVLEADGTGAGAGAERSGRARRLPRARASVIA